MISETFEIRWFFDSPPAAFRAVHGRPEQRTDWYAPSSDGATSVKLRGADPDSPGRVESKLRSDSRIAVLYGNEQHRVEAWVKISLVAEDGDAAAERLWRHARQHWCQVVKRRWLRFDRLQDGHWITAPETDAGDYVEVEWSEVRIAERPAWTFCLEAPRALGSGILQNWFDHHRGRDSLIPDLTGCGPTQSWPERLA
ncbi:hypothetical protein [Roseimaritima ulvae]|uniref:CYTH domain-containing protein n=1 Tax=Roseimaritima ulvae TaxID=980254 RepID=A0A5B9QI19_9BACT|nr:hypothetical protein [Roseimaritima ulvae]QEG38767.1 hypothetical protein UC8_07250 [Roseimaritima ulvae]